ncbi:MAG: 50S ribosomal protein L21 [Candidatus Hodarchaeales archaeon]|jgi:large subunit ribosomal protein L21
MPKYAVLRIKGNQYLVKEGEEVLVDKLDSGKPHIEVLLFVNNKKVKIGNPVIKSAKIEVKVLKQEEKGKKIYVRKFKAKSRYRRKYGFRPHYSRLLVKNISI